MIVPPQERYNGARKVREVNKVINQVEALTQSFSGVVPGPLSGRRLPLHTVTALGLVLKVNGQEPHISTAVINPPCLNILWLKDSSARLQGRVHLVTFPGPQ